MHPSSSCFPATGRSLGRAARVSFLGVALLGSSLALVAEDSATPPPLLDKPLPTSGTDSVDSQPSPQHVYVSGHWSWKDGAYSWESGHWELPPTEGTVWVAPRWEKKEGGYALVEGGWRNAADSADDDAIASASTATVVEEAPPPPPREVIIARPSPSHVWIGGYWGFEAGRRVWVPGRWDLPPRGGVVWVAPRWVRHGHGYVFIPGVWREVGVHPRTTVVVENDGWRSDGIVVVAPPPPRREYHRPPCPGVGFVWIDGYWAWHGGRHVWIGGRWDRPPHGRRHWVAPRWEHRGHGYIFIEGCWR